MEHFLQNIHEKTNQIVKEQMHLYNQNLEMQLHCAIICKLCSVGRILPGEILHKEKMPGTRNSYYLWSFP